MGGTPASFDSGLMTLRQYPAQGHKRKSVGGLQGPLSLGGNTVDDLFELEVAESRELHESGASLFDLRLSPRMVSMAPQNKQFVRGQRGAHAFSDKKRFATSARGA